MHGDGDKQAMPGPGGDSASATAISVSRARELILSAVAAPPPSERVELGAALGRVLASNVQAAGDVPPFDNSAMDGFAVLAGPAGRALRIVDESRAGSPAGARVEAGTAIRISTGAALPQGAEAVIALERAEEAAGEVRLNAAVRPGENVRRAGEDMLAGATVLRRGSRLGAVELAVAAGAGVASLACARRPRLAIVATGDELVAPGTPLGPGQIHDSNVLALTALAAAAGAVVTGASHTPDDATATADALEAALDGADVLVISGGVSVGPHDHVKQALESLGVQQRFWRVALRPGRPTWFGTRGHTLVFGLPGNPVSAIVTFLLFVRPALAALQGADPLAVSSCAALTTALPRNPGRDEAVRVRLEHADGVLRARPTGPQGSHIVTSLLGADALAVVPAGEGMLEAGAVVAVELI